MPGRTKKGITMIRHRTAFFVHVFEWAGQLGIEAASADCQVLLFLVPLRQGRPDTVARHDLNKYQLAIARAGLHGDGTVLL